MTTLAVAAIAAATAGAVYALGVWQGRRNPRKPLDRHPQFNEFRKEVLADAEARAAYDQAQARRNPSRVLLGWCIAGQHMDCPYETDSRTHPGRRLRCTCSCGHLGGRSAERYRLAWLSARRRAHRGRLLAQLLDEREDEPAKRLVLHPDDVTVAFDMSGHHDLQHVAAYIYDPPNARMPDGRTPA